MKPIIILVHGMGFHKKGDITKQFVSGVNETAKCLSLEDFDISKEVTLVEFHYSDTLDKIRKKISKNADAIKTQGFSALAGKGVSQKIITSLVDMESSFGDDSMISTHWLDVALYGSTHFGEMIRVKFAKLLNNKIKNANGREIHIMCHSLGTAVVHDALAKIYRKDADIKDHIPDLIPGAFNVNSLWTFANVSRLVNLLNGLEDPMDSLVTTGSNGCTDYFYNVRHKLDPFTWFKRYDRAMDSSKTFENKVIRRWNTHDFAEYVSDPLVTQRILQTLTTRTKQNANENLAKCVSEHKSKTINEAVEKFSAPAFMAQGKQIQSFSEAVEAINELMDTVEKFKNDFNSGDGNA